MNSMLSFDLDPPIECDDEYWDHPDPEKAWKQPPDKPSYITAFLLMLKLMQLLAFTLRTVVSIHIPGRLLYSLNNLSTAVFYQQI
jgi:hypothetical protein